MPSDAAGATLAGAAPSPMPPSSPPAPAAAAEKTPSRNDHTPSSSPRLVALRPRSPFFRSPRGFARLHMSQASDPSVPASDPERSAATSPSKPAAVGSTSPGPTSQALTTHPHHHRLALNLWGGQAEAGRAPRASSRAGEELDPTTAAQISSIRSALHAPSQTVRVVDAETGEVFDLHLKRSDPYAIPTAMRADRPASVPPTTPKPMGSRMPSPKTLSRAATPKLSSGSVAPKGTPPPSSAALSAGESDAGPRDASPASVEDPTSSPASPSPRPGRPLTMLGGRVSPGPSALGMWPPDPEDQEGSTTHPRLKKLSRVVARPKSRSTSRTRAENGESRHNSPDHAGASDEDDDQSIASRGAAARSMVPDLRSVEAAQLEEERNMQRLLRASFPPSLSPPTPKTISASQTRPDESPTVPDSPIRQLSPPVQIDERPAPSTPLTDLETITPPPQDEKDHALGAQDREPHSPPHQDVQATPSVVQDCAIPVPSTRSNGAVVPRPQPTRLYTAPEDPAPAPAPEMNGTVHADQGSSSDGADTAMSRATSSMGSSSSRPLAHPVARHGGLVLNGLQYPRPPVPNRSDSGMSARSGETTYSTASESISDHSSRGITFSDSPPTSALGLPGTSKSSPESANSGSGMALDVANPHSSSATSPATASTVRSSRWKQYPSVPPALPESPTSSDSPLPVPVDPVTTPPESQQEGHAYGMTPMPPASTSLPVKPAAATGGTGQAPVPSPAPVKTKVPAHAPPGSYSPGGHGHPVAHPRGQRMASVGSVGESILSPTSPSGSGGCGAVGGAAGLPRGKPRRGSTLLSSMSGNSGRPSLTTICTGDAAFDEEANKNAERLRRQRRAKADPEEMQSPISPASTGYATPGMAGTPTTETNLGRRWSRQQQPQPQGEVHHAQPGAAPQVVVTSPPTSPLSRPAVVITDRPCSPSAEPAPSPRPAVGKLIDESHANYVLMYNMLTGIRIAVSRCEAKPRRPLTAADYKARHKFTFDIVGNELAPKSNYDFRFKTYCSEVFRDLRALFHLDTADYLLSLTSQYILSELGSPGKSGSFFYFSGDYRFIIKTIRHSEHKFLLKILAAYHEHVRKNPHTLLSRFYGLHRVKLPGGKKIHFVIMNNLFPPHRDIHETYDLKGSLVGREYPEWKAAQKKGATMKDINWLRRDRRIELGPDKNKLFQAQLRSDVGLLARLNVMDYSLLIGLHDLRKGNSENLRQEKLTLFQPRPLSPDEGGGVGPNAGMARAPSSRPLKPKRGPDATAVRQAVQRSDPRSFDHADRELPDKDGRERLYCVFYQEEGGFRSTSPEDNVPGEWIYYMGVIDLFTPYSLAKRAEHIFKSICHDRHMISPVAPKEYGRRFLRFMRTITDPDGTWPGWRHEAELAEKKMRPPPELAGTDAEAIKHIEPEARALHPVDPEKTAAAAPTTGL